MVFTLHGAEPEVQLTKNHGKVFTLYGAEPEARFTKNHGRVFTLHGAELEAQPNKTMEGCSSSMVLSQKARSPKNHGRVLTLHAAEQSLGSLLSVYYQLRKSRQRPDLKPQKEGYEDL